MTPQAPVLGYADLPNYTGEGEKSDKHGEMMFGIDQPSSEPQDNNNLSKKSSQVGLNNSSFESETTANNLVSADSSSSELSALSALSASSSSSGSANGIVELSTPRKTRGTRSRIPTESNGLSSSSIATSGSFTNLASDTSIAPAPMTPSNKRKSCIVDADEFRSLGDGLLSGAPAAPSSSTVIRTRNRSHSTAALTSINHNTGSNFIQSGPSSAATMKSSVSYNSNLSSHIMMTPQSQKNNFNSLALLNPLAPSSGVNPFYTPPAFLTPSKRVNTLHLEERSNDYKTIKKRPSMVTIKDNDDDKDNNRISRVSNTISNTNKDENLRNKGVTSDNGSDNEAKTDSNNTSINKDSDDDSDDETMLTSLGRRRPLRRSQSSTNTVLNAYNSINSQSQMQHLFATPISRGEGYGHLTGNSIVSSVASQPATNNSNITSLMPVFLGTPGMVISPHSGMLQSRTLDIFDDSSNNTNNNNTLGSPHHHRNNSVLYSHTHSRYNQRHQQAQYNQQFTTNIDDENDDMWSSKTKQQSAAQMALKIANGVLPTFSSTPASLTNAPGGHRSLAMDMSSHTNMSINTSGNYGSPMIYSSPPPKTSLSSSPFSKYIHSNFIKESPRPPSKSGGNGYLKSPNSNQDHNANLLGFPQNSLLDDPFEEDHHHPRNFSNLPRPPQTTDQPSQMSTMLPEDFRASFLETAHLGTSQQAHTLGGNLKGYVNKSSVQTSPARSYPHNYQPGQTPKSNQQEQGQAPGLQSQLHEYDQGYLQGQHYQRHNNNNRVIINNNHHQTGPSVVNTPARTISQSSSSSSLSLDRLDIDTPPLFAPVLDAIKHIDKPHKCPHCTKRFKRMEHVRRHAKTHTAEKPFTCDVEDCGRKFSRHDNLRAHLKTHTKKGGRNSFIEGLVL